PFASHRPSWGGGLRCQIQKSLRAESLSPRRTRAIRARTFTPHKRYLGVIFAARDVVPDEGNATICRDSGARVGRRASTCSVRCAWLTGIVRARGILHCTLSLLWRVDRLRPAPQDSSRVPPAKGGTFRFPLVQPMRSQRADSLKTSK